MGRVSVIAVRGRAIPRVLSLTFSSAAGEMMGFSLPRSICANGMYRASGSFALASAMGSTHSGVQ